LFTLNIVHLLITSGQSWHFGYFFFTKAQKSDSGFTVGNLELGAQVRSFYDPHLIV